MLTIEGIYDGQKIEPLKPIPFKKKKKVVITFLNEVLENTGLELEIDPIKALRGCDKGTNLSKKLIESRREDIELEQRKWQK
ncbi:MAG: hypothetical protein ACNY01_14415 [Desulfobacteria bacterium]|jgi:hypothetical protein|nr:hypothetical protein [Deltaproteobacteria bacterium]